MQIGLPHTLNIQVQQDRQSAEDKAKQDRQLADDKAKQDTLVKYLDQMADSLQHGLLKAKPGDDQFIVAQSRTVLALQSLDRKRQHLVMQFLSASGLNDPPDENWEPSDKQGQRNPLPAKSRVLLYAAQLSKAALVNSDLSGAVLLDANLMNANLGCTSSERQDPGHCSDLSGADLRGANLTNAHLEGAILFNADLTNAHLFYSNLSGADLTLAHLSGADLTNAHLEDANLSEANLSEAVLLNTDLRGAILYGAILRGVILYGAILSGAHLYGAILSGADLNGSFLLYTDLSQAKDLTPQQLEGKEPPFLCNVALPKAFTVNPNRDCDRLPQALFERDPRNFKTLKDAETYVKQARQQKWTDDTSPGK